MLAAGLRGVDSASLEPGIIGRNALEQPDAPASRKHSATWVNGEHLPDSQSVLASFLVVSQVTSLPAGLRNYGQYCCSHACKCRQENSEAFSVSKEYLQAATVG